MQNRTRLLDALCLILSRPLAYSVCMPAPPLRKERWTLSVDRRLKHAVVAQARQRGVPPAQVLEDLIREKLNPFGHTDVADPTAYVRTLRCKSRELTDEAFLADLKRWEKVVS
jgi:hypothetical protein